MYIALSHFISIIVFIQTDDNWKQIVDVEQICFALVFSIEFQEKTSWGERKGSLILTTLVV